MIFMPSRTFTLLSICGREHTPYLPLNSNKYIELHLMLTLTQYTYMDLTDITSITHITVFILFLTFDLQYFSYNLYRGYLIIYVICCNYCFILLILYAEMYAPNITWYTTLYRLSITLNNTVQTPGRSSSSRPPPSRYSHFVVGPRPL